MAGRVFEGVTCYLCQEQGHFAKSCPFKSAVEKAKEDRKKISAKQQYYKGVEMKSDDDKDEDSSGDESLNVQWAFSYYSDEVASKYNNKDILLDTGSTVSVFKNNKLITGIKKTSGKLRAFSNGVWQDSQHVGMVPKFF